MLDSDLKSEIESVLLPYLSERKIDLIELRLNRYRTMLTVDVLVDVDGGGIDISACAGVNRFLNDTLEENAWIDGDYVVEVSSPGIDRPLKTVKDFKRVISRLVVVYLHQNELGFKLEYRGRLQSVEDTQVTIDQVPTDGESTGKNKKTPVSKGIIVIPMAIINKGMQII